MKPKLNRAKTRSNGKSTTNTVSQPLFCPSSRIGFWQLNVESGKISWSENTRKLFSLPPAAVLPSTLEELTGLIYHEDQSMFISLLHQSLRKKKEMIVEARVRSSAKAFSWFEFSGNVVAMKGKTSRFMGAFYNITQKKVTEYELADWKQRHELVSESAGLLIYDYNVNTGDIVWTGNVNQVVGFTSEEMGRIERWENLIHPDDRDEASRALEIAKITLRPYDVHYRFRTKNGAYCHMHDRGLFVADGGSGLRMLGIMNDVSERVSAVRTIEQSEKSYRELFNSVGEAIYIQDPDGTIIDVNQEACRMYGFSRDEFIGKTPAFLAASGKNDFERLAQQLQEALQGVHQSFRWWGKKKSGEHFLKEVKITRGSYFGADVVIASAFDITNQVIAQQSLQESEKRFRTMIQDLNVGVVLLNGQGEIQIANKAVLKMFHQTEGRFLHKSLTDPGWKFIRDDSAAIDHVDLPWNLAVQLKKHIRGNVIGIQQHDNSTVWVLVNAAPTIFEEDQVLHVLVTLTDITERRIIEENLRESELRFRTLQEASFGGIGLHDHGRIVDCNQGLCDITGYTFAELIGSNGLELLAPEYRELAINKIQTRDETPYDVEGIRKDGTRYFLEIHGKNVPYQDGTRRVTEFRDITERKKVEAKILEQNARLQEVTEDLRKKNDQLQEFTQIVSHNLRAPVSNILSLLNFIEQASTDQERNEYIQFLKEAGARTLTTLQELNEVLQIKQNRNIEKQHLIFSEVLQNVQNMMNVKIAEAGAEIITDFTAAPSVDYPNIYLESILLNLLSNALKYAFPGRKPVIKLTTGIDEGRTFLAVRDNGVGLNMQRYGHQIFKLRKTFHKHPESRGIGLFMVKNQIEAMGGEITFDSEENVGSVFRIVFNKSQINE